MREELRLEKMIEVLENKISQLEAAINAIKIKLEVGRNVEYPYVIKVKDNANIDMTTNSTFTVTDSIPKNFF